MRKAEMQDKKEHAFMLYMNGMTQKEIAERVKTTPVTVSKWVKTDGWEQRRAASNITRPELVNKLLITINHLIERVMNSEDIELSASLPDKLAKFAATIEKLEKKANIVDTIEVFMAFHKWLQYRRSFDEDVTPELLSAINKYQDLYIGELISKKC
jgi:transcriptional regulator with XRE-family HTH domain